MPRNILKKDKTSTENFKKPYPGKLKTKTYTIFMKQKAQDYNTMFIGRKVVYNDD